MCDQVFRFNILEVSMRAKQILVVVVVAVAAISLGAQTKQSPVTGQAAFADWSQEKPGTLRKISISDLPEPDPAQSVRAQPHIVARPEKAWPVTPPGFKVTLYAGGDNGPSPSPDPAALAATRHEAAGHSGGGIIFVLRGMGPKGKAAQVERFASGLDHPFGIAFYPVDNPALYTSQIRRL